MYLFVYTTTLWAQALVVVVDVFLLLDIGLGGSLKKTLSKVEHHSFPSNDRLSRYNISLSNDLSVNHF